MTYTVINGEHKAIKPYYTKASIEHKIGGMKKAIYILTNDADVEQNTKKVY